MEEQKNKIKGWISFRVKPTEYDQIHSHFKSTTCRKLSEYARNVLLQKPVLVKFRNKSADDFLADMNKLKKDLNGVANNFNQAVHKLHTLDQIAEFRTWIMMYENSRQAVEKKDRGNKIPNESNSQAMVARITFPDEILKALNYHEQKVNKGVAECLLAENFLLDTNQLKFYDKLNRFKSQLELNTTVKTTLLHASLNFDPSETISKDELIQIATTYMNKIGFSDQPYLVYQHEDAGHPHIHILTTTIKDNGLPIYVHNIGRNQSQKARDEIENEFGLIKASSRNNNRDNDIPPVNIEKAIYGKSETKRSIINVLDAVINQYKYTSIAELNAVLQLGNVTADRGKEGGRIHRNAGLVYRVLDQAGNKIGKPIKASSIYSQPTLAKLEIKFNANKLRKVPSRNSLKKVVTNNLDISTSMTDFIANLKRQKIDTTIRRNDSGFIYGITFVDHNSKCVFNGRDLDKKLSAAAIQQKFTFAAAPLQNNPVGKTRTESKVPYNKPQQDPVTRSIPREFSFDVFKEPRKSHNDLIKQFDLLKQLLQIEKSFNPTPFDLTRKKKRKKKKKSQNS